MLQAAELPLPKRVWAHGFVQLGGERFSKSAGVKLELGEAIDRFGADAFRYFLMREVPFDADGNFSWERFEDRYNADLANAWGNLASRTISMIEKYCESVVPTGGPTTLDAGDAEDIAEYHAAMSGERGYLLHEGLKAVWSSVARGNEFVDRQAPWKLAKDPAQRPELDTTMASLARHLARHCVLLYPFMPAKTLELWQALGARDAGRAALDTLAGPAGGSAGPLFRRTSSRRHSGLAEFAEPPGQRCLAGCHGLPEDEMPPWLVCVYPSFRLRRMRRWSVLLIPRH
jgi:methionyl-tRNA synthetase